jgi:putative hemolysin
MTMLSSSRRRHVIVPKLAAFLISACGEESPRPAGLAQIANPASVYCEKRGGRLELVDEAEGQTGYCVLPDGRRVEEWALFRASQAEEEATSGMPVSRGSKPDAKQ